LEDMLFWVYVYVLEVAIPVCCKLVWCDLLAEAVYCDGPVGLACWDREI
jgi:hypothetical protein